MKKVVKVLLAQRTTDKRFLALDCEREPSCTIPYYVDDPELAERKKLWDPADLKNPKKATYYFENSDRAREWLKDCVMVPYEITTEVIAKPI